ncbi:MAG: hypothetical protein LBD58_08600 [Treponema sp.]|jgi:hypothetical protein|nr:hypothetical protein [Treponema sp.]
MLRKHFLIIALIGLSNNVCAQNFSISADPITFVGFVVWALTPQDENGEQRSSDIRNMWLCFELNMETNNKKELGFGVFARFDKFALRTQYRSFFNKERQSGFFWGLYGHIEWRKMYWIYNENNEIAIGWNFPFVGNDNVFHSIGITGGVDVGFRFRKGNFGITPYIGLGIPLFYCFGDLPPEKDKESFDFQNITFRAIDIGIRFDFFQ